MNPKKQISRKELLDELGPSMDALFGQIMKSLMTNLMMSIGRTKRLIQLVSVMLSLKLGTNQGSIYQVQKKNPCR